MAFLANEQAGGLGSEVGLFHMNGRLYDPTLHTFLMPDNFVQQPENTQSYNRYAYVLNNPLLYTDPSGEFIPLLVAIAIGAFISALTYTVTAYINGSPFSASGLITATFIGAATSTFVNFYSQAAFQALAHGTFQGVMSEINGENLTNNINYLF